MFFVATATFQLLYALIVLGHDRRRIIHSSKETAAKPGPAWIAALARGQLTFAPELALSASVFAFIPFHELAVLHHVFSDQGHGILPVIVEGDIADDGAAVLYIAERRSHVLSVGTDLLDSVEDHVHGHIGECAIGLRRVVIFLRVVLHHEELAARQLLGRRAFTEGK